jgi:hypothetical protein
MDLGIVNSDVQKKRKPSQKYWYCHPLANGQTLKQVQGDSDRLLRQPPL